MGKKRTDDQDTQNYTVFLKKKKTRSREKALMVQLFFIGCWPIQPPESNWPLHLSMLPHC
jgi:hypothetical protein